VSKEEVRRRDQPARRHKTALDSSPVSESLQPPFSTREQRIAYNEAWSRTINEKGADWKLGREPMPDFRCECWKKGCEQDISLSGEDWKLARAKPNRFAVAPHHVAADFEAVVTTFPHFWLVEKFGEAGEIAEELASSERGQADLR
jgi:hypothetical protein